METNLKNIEIAKRFAYFRKNFIANRASAAAPLLGISQPTIVRMEQDMSPTVTIDLLNVLQTKYNLNYDWLMTGEGEPQRTPEERKVSMTFTDIIKIKSETQAILKQLRLSKENYAFTVKKLRELIEKQNARIEKLEGEVKDLRMERA